MQLVGYSYNIVTVYEKYCAIFKITTPSHVGPDLLVVQAPNLIANATVLYILWEKFMLQINEIE